MTKSDPYEYIHRLKRYLIDKYCNTASGMSRELYIPVYYRGQLWYTRLIRVNHCDPHSHDPIEILLSLEHDLPWRYCKTKQSVCGIELINLYIIELGDRNHEYAFRYNEEAIEMNLYQTRKEELERIIKNSRSSSIDYQSSLGSYSGISGLGLSKSIDRDIHGSKKEEPQKKSEPEYFKNKPLIINKIEL